MKEAIQQPKYPDATIAAVATLSVCATIVNIVDKSGDDDGDEDTPPARRCFNTPLPQLDIDDEIVVAFKL
jgi:hypothetical protein